MLAYIAMRLTKTTKPAARKNRSQIGVRFMIPIRLRGAPGYPVVGLRSTYTAIRQFTRRPIIRRPRVTCGYVRPDRSFSISSKLNCASFVGGVFAPGDLVLDPPNIFQAELLQKRTHRDS